MTSGSVIIFAPHPDDETLGCGGIIAKRISEGYDVAVVVITDGRFAFKIQGVLSDPSPAEIKKIRKSEAQNALRILGVKEENLFFLNFEDCSLEEHADSVELMVLDILKERQPIEVYFPYSKDSNIDHRVTNRIVQNAITKSGLSMIKWEYSVGRPYGELDLIKDLFLDLFIHKIFRVDITTFLNLKEAALKEYKSQISIISRKQKQAVVKPRLIKMHSNNYELFYKA